ncbi:DNA polymerase subunit gamma-1 [Orchesella cincta]|uniref:DNA polymerase subunit gamma-1 n=1 Tax=Orchesella cincta TaxID=48709 RepID=A0A1D2NF39_ORCCI|nr:DNA polymerase subunit gamma-1 [Orchesella cincta]
MHFRGWTKYLANDSFESVPFPEEDVMIFDVEVCVTVGNAPTLACALSPNGWYSWCSDMLVDETAFDSNAQEAKYRLEDLIPLETHRGEFFFPPGRIKEKIIVGHNVSYDRARIKEQYFLQVRTKHMNVVNQMSNLRVVKFQSFKYFCTKGSKTRFMDTMSLHIAVSGITSYQRALKLTAKSGLNALGPAQMKKLGLDSSILEWNDQSSLNNLADVYKLYCDKELSKSTRDVFVKGSLNDIRDQFQSLVSYCASDVEATKQVFSNILPLYYERFPHPVTLAGMLEMGTTYLPINSKWLEYIQKSEDVFNGCEMEVKAILMEKAEEALELLKDERSSTFSICLKKFQEFTTNVVTVRYKEDPWLWDLDWKVPKRRKSKTQSALNETPSYPAWYRKLLYKETDADYLPGPAKISTSMQLVPKILRLTWFGFPLYYSRKGGWGFLVSSIEDKECSSSSEEKEDLGMDDSEKDTHETTDQSTFPYVKWLELWTKAKERLLSKQYKNKKTGKQSITDLAGIELRNKSEASAEEIMDFIRGLETLSSSGLWSKGKRKKKADSVSSECSPHPKCMFVPLPHKDGPNNRVGNPLAKDFLAKIEEGILSSADDNDFANKVVRLSKMTSYWRNNRDRIMGQMTVWHDQEQVSLQDADKEPSYGAILPQVAVSGTLTRRAVEPTWMTASNAYEDRIGSELKGMIQAPPSYHFVGADVDSQELWIASVIGDASFSGIHGSTALGWMTLQGNKSAGTDMHSKTASLIGIGRDQAKILNYGRIYGAGVNFAERLLMQFNRQLSSTEARSKSKSMYKMTKGERKYLLNEVGRGLCDVFEDLRDKKYEAFSKNELRNLMDYHQIPPQHLMELVDKLVWDGGTESHMFNRLEEIAQGECPITPILKCCISRSLVPSVVQNDASQSNRAESNYQLLKVNWVVQSSAVDYLHLMLTCMRWLIEKYDIDARFSISVHDEVRFLVKSEDRYRAALALQITNLLTRAVCSYQLGMNDLPMSVAFFSCIDIDKVLRKEVTQNCLTPSNPQGLSSGYGIPLGEGLDINQLITKTKGSLEKVSPLSHPELG